MTEAIVLSDEEVASLVNETTHEDFVGVVRHGYEQRGKGAPAKPRQTLNRSEGKWGMLTSYMAILPETGMMGGYMYDVGFDEEDGWLTTSLWDAQSGEFLTHLDGNPWNPQKTGATGAVGVDALARPDASSLGVIGSGTQARGQVLATATVRDFERVKVYSPTEESRQSFVESLDNELAAEVTAVKTSSAAVSGSDVVITATTSSEPVFEGSALDSGTHVTAMGQYSPDARELDTETIKRAKYVPDLRERVHQDAGSFITAHNEGVVGDEHIHAELGEVIAGTASGRTEEDEITVFDSGGTGIETVAAAAMLYDMAVERDFGTPISIVRSSESANLVGE